MQPAELAFGLRIGTFYSIIGIILGSNNVIIAGYIGFGLHLLIGTLLGIALGAIGIRWRKIRMLIPIKSSLVGMGAGIVVWLILFLPITSLLIQPSMRAHRCNFSNRMAEDHTSRPAKPLNNKHCTYCNSIPPCLGSNIWLCDEFTAKN